MLNNNHLLKEFISVEEFQGSIGNRSRYRFASCKDSLLFCYLGTVQSFPIFSLICFDI